MIDAMTNDLQGHSRLKVQINHHDHKILQVKKIHTNLTSRLTTDWRPAIVCTHSIPKRRHKNAMPYAKQIFFYDSQNLMGSFSPQTKYKGSD